MSHRIFKVLTQLEGCIHKNLLEVPLGENLRNVINFVGFGRGNVNPLSVSFRVGEK
jgi:hypothetical protein